MDPGRSTLRELVTMAEARLRHQWDHTSALLAVMLNQNRDPRRSRAIAPEELHPYRRKVRRRPSPVIPAEITLLKQVFVDHRPCEVS